MGQVAWYVVGGVGIAIATEGFLLQGWWPLNVVGGVLLFQAAFMLARNIDVDHEVPTRSSPDDRASA